MRHAAKTLDARLREHDNQEVIPAKAGIQEPYVQLQTALVVELAAREEFACETAEAILVTIRPRYRRGVIEHSMARLQEVKDRAESRRTNQGGNSPGGGTSQGSRGRSEGVAQFLAELIDLGFEHRLQQLYRQFESGEISLGYFAKELGLGVRDLYAALEQRGLPTANIGAPPPAADSTSEEPGTARLR